MVFTAGIVRSDFNWRINVNVVDHSLVGGKIDQQDRVLEENFAYICDLIGSQCYSWSVGVMCSWCLEPLIITV